ncbi:MAG: hypothetical protein AAFU60_01640 [Bacteroidota bacterium]
MSRNFHDLEDDMEREFRPPPQIRENVEANLGVFRFIGNIVELYIPRLFDLFVRMSGGEAPTEPSVKGPQAPNTPGSDPNRPPSGPPNLSA